jgi:predicted small secreted protein
MKTIRLFLALATVLCLAACGTIDGFGKDISGSAQWTKERLSGSKPASQ